MDWKYKHFHQEKVFAAPPDLVFETVRGYVTDTLGWKIAETDQGLTGEGQCFLHRAIASFRVEPAANATKLIIVLQVERAGSSGFMLWDVGGYYNIQIRKWFEGIQWLIHQRLAGGEIQSAAPVPATNKFGACVFNGCLVFIVAGVALWFTVNLISAMIGLLTGTLYLFGRGGTVVVHGIWARIVSALILALGVFIVWKMMRKRTERKLNNQSAADF
jgi:hypothetical protein